MDRDTRERMARAIHSAYRSEQKGRLAPDDASMADWEHLPETLRRSNHLQADDIIKKLQMIGCEVSDATGEGTAVRDFTTAEIELMAEMEHERWNEERLADGWTLGPEKDVSKKISPYIIPWPALPDDVREWDRQTVRKIPEFLSSVGLKAIKK